MGNNWTNHNEECSKVSPVNAGKSPGGKARHIPKAENQPNKKNPDQSADTGSKIYNEMHQ